MGLLVYNDYISMIQEEDLLQIINSNLSVLNKVAAASEQEVKGYLSQRYRVDEIFKPTTTFDINKTYYANDLVEYTAKVWDSTLTYNTSDRISYSGFVYSAISGSTNINPLSTGGTYTWSSITEDKALYYITLPYPAFDINKNYVAGEIVFYNDVVYTAVHNLTGNVPGYDANIWSPGITYTVTGSTPDDTTKFTKGDNRNAWLVQCVADVTLYHAFCRINPRFITELRAVRYDGNSPTQSGGVKKWLRDVANGVIVADLPEILPITGLVASYGTNDKTQENTY